MSRISVALLLCLTCCGGARGPERAPPARVDIGAERIEGLMQRWSLPGGQVVIARDGRVLYSGAFGVARAGESVNDRTRFRIASLSKAITAVAVHLLAEEGRLDLDAPVLPILGGAPADRRWHQITVRHLLEHSGGFDRHASRDWMFESNRVREQIEGDGPPELDDILRVVMQRRLDFTPGERFAYSNLGYAMLGAVVERVSGVSYEHFVRAQILRPAGIERVQLGRTRVDERPADEARYFPHPDEALARSVFRGEGEVPTPDGGFYMRPMAAHGGWIASASDVARFLARVDGRASPPDLLSLEALERVLAPPRHPDWEGMEIHYGHGFFVQRSERGRAWLHDGSKPGTTAFMMRAEDGTVLVALFNGRPVRGDVSRAIERELRALQKDLPG